MRNALAEPACPGHLGIQVDGVAVPGQFGEGIDQALVDQFLEGIRYEEISKQSPLVLRSFRAKRDKDILKENFQDTEIVVTVDDHLLFYDLLAPLSKAEVKYQMGRVFIQPKKDRSEEIYVVEKSPGILFESNKKTLVRFPLPEGLAEFQQYIEKFNQKTPKPK